MIADGKPDLAWQAAQKHDGHLVELMLGARYIPDANVRAQLFAPVVAPCSAQRKMPPRKRRRSTPSAWTRPDAATFDLLAREVKPDADARRARRSHRVAAADS